MYETKNPVILTCLTQNLINQIDMVFFLGYKLELYLIFLETKNLVIIHTSFTSFYFFYAL